MHITTEEIFEEFEELDPRDQSQFLLELGYDLPRFPPEEQRECDLIHGCQSQVWLTARAVEDGSDPVIEFRADSDAEIVRGLIAILLASYSGHTASEILRLPINDVFTRLRLKQYISPQRHNGLQGMVDRIREIARRHAPCTAYTEQSPVQVVLRQQSPAQTVASIDPQEIRRQFPVLNQVLEDGLTPVYLDSGASAQKPQVVIDKEREVEEQYFANAYRGRYRFGARIDEELETARQKIATFISAESPQQIAFTSGTTATLNAVAFGWGTHHVGAGDEILITEMEHHANFVPWQQLAIQRQATLRFIPMTDDGQLDISRLDEVLTTKTKLLAVCGMSNVLGTVNPIKELAARAHEVGAVIVVDAAQSVPHQVTNVVADDVDFLIFSGHKLYGPTGVGILYGKADRLNETQPILFGGHMIDRVYKDHSTWAAPPARFEAGTLPIVQAIGLGTAVDWISGLSVEAIHNHEQRLLRSATEQLQQIPGLTIFGPSVDHKGAIISFRIDDVHPEDLAIMLDRRAVLTRHGHHCAMPLHDLLGVSATTRASFAAYNTDDDVTALVSAIEYARDELPRRP
ncbi:MAG TPA: SufS family cysteine desulfurase [Planctomycetes bacterium]|nr:SufS family cysteine desulfurase [Fuerstiella sp.]HIK93574.1 SufS family cysteine desulfurase [Planctomycetota bacterium]